MPSIILRFKAENWEETDVSYLNLMGLDHVLQRACFKHRMGEDVVTEGGFIFIWR